jgi:hypothetical protein
MTELCHFCCTLLASAWNPQGYVTIGGIEKNRNACFQLVFLIAVAFIDRVRFFLPSGVGTQYLDVVVC